MGKIPSSGPAHGGDDYLVKPFTCEMLQARMEANLRRMRGGRGGGILSFPSFELDRAGHAIVRNGERKGLSPIEFNLLEFFCNTPTKTSVSASCMRTSGEGPAWGMCAL